MRRHPRRPGRRGDARLRAGRSPAATPGTEPRRPRATTAAAQLRTPRVPPPIDIDAVEEFVAIAGPERWRERLGVLRGATLAPTRQSKRALQFPAVELVIDRLRAGVGGRSLTAAELRIAKHAADTARMHQALSRA